MPRIELALGQIALALIATHAAAQTTPEQAQALETKICQTPAASIDLKAAALVSASGRVPVPVLGIVVPAASKQRPSEARFVALSASDDESLCDFVWSQHALPDSSAQLFPGAFRMLTADEQVLTLKAVALAREPLRFNARKDRFEGRVSVGVVAILDSSARPKLAAPVPFQLLGELSATPKAALVDHVGPPYADFAVSTPSLSCPLELRVVSAVTPQAVDLSLSAAPSVRLRARPVRIQAFGLASTDLTFELVGPRQGLSGDVRLFATEGQLSGTSFGLLAGHASAQLRSARVGMTTVTVAGAGLAPATLKVAVVFPWGLVLAALAGALAGVFAGRRLEVTREDVLASLLLGLFLVSMYIWAMGHAPLALPAPVGELLLFTLASLGAYHGTRLLARLGATRASGRS